MQRNGGTYLLRAAVLALVCGIVALFKGDLGWQAPVAGGVLIVLALLAGARGLVLLRRVRRRRSVDAGTADQQLTGQQTAGMAGLGVVVVFIGVFKYVTDPEFPSLPALFDIAIAIGGVVLVVVCLVSLARAARRR